MKVEYVAGLSVLISAIALIVSILSYRHSKSTRLAELRMRLADEFSELDVLRRDAMERLEYANRSRTRVLAIRQPGGAERLWAEEYERDRTFLRRLLDAAPADAGSHERLSDGELEVLVGAVRRSVTELKALRVKYEKVLADDDQFRRDRAAAMEQRAAR